MHFFLILTNNCNLKCKYCIGKECDNYFDNSINTNFEIDYEIPDSINYTISDLKRFFENDKKPTIIFYGGEPLLEAGKIREVMDSVNARFMLQTNGLLLRDLDDYVLRLHNVMFSIDGVKEVTDNNRGVNVYDTIIENVKWLRAKGFKREVLARMTATPINDMYRDVKHLLTIFDSVHWQLDAGFFPDYNEKKFGKWMAKYNREIKRLINWWVNEMKNGKVYKIYPFIGVVKSLLKNEKKKLRCGAGHSQYAITTNGDIYACPVIAGIKEFKVGDIFRSDPVSLKKVELSSPCTNCSIIDECGGRCLYANKTKLWGEGYKKVCENVKVFLSELKKAKPLIEELIKNKSIKVSDFDFDEFNSCEIIP
ncbi:7-carboxy-7-deazaguanine synthase [Candidatus Tiddalikarchaeum anstoanum]|nr:7-carboxy-7-deazaguanine synthase [Candidatus Tiddalikarchaeum anstoanum]